MTSPRLLSLPSLPALRHRNYRLFFLGQGTSLIGTWMTSVAQSWLVLQLTGNPFDLGLITAAQFTPVLVLGLFGGLIADGLPKRRTLYATQIVAMAVSFTLFLLTATHTVQLWHVFALAIVMGIRNSIDMPTRQAFGVEMVGRDDIGNAVALNSSMFNGARVVGPAIAGIVIGAFGVSLAFLIDAISFLAVIVGLALMSETDLRPAPRMAQARSAGAIVDNLSEGLRYVRQTPIVLMALSVVGVIATAAINFSVFVPPLAQNVLLVGASGYGFLMAASGIGSLLAALAIAFGGTRPERMVIGGLVLGGAMVALGLSHNFALDLVLMFLAGAGAITMMATVNTTIQLAVPDVLRGRVMAVYTTVFAGTNPIGGLFVGAIAATAGVLEAILLGGLISVAAAIVAGIWLRRIRGASAASAVASASSSSSSAPASVPGVASGAAPATRTSSVGH